MRLLVIHAHPVPESFNSASSGESANMPIGMITKRMLKNRFIVLSDYTLFGQNYFAQVLLPHHTFFIHPHAFQL